MRTNKLVSLLFLMIVLQNLNGQDYHPLLGETNEWYIVTQVHEGVATYKYYANRDTVIYDQVYKILEGYPCFDCIYDTLIHGFLREDTVSRKIYIRSNSELTGVDKEYIYIDFSLNVDDSIKLYNINWSGIDSLDYFKVDSVKMINTLFGDRRAFYLSGDGYNCRYCYCWDGYLIWVEGIGSLSSPLCPHTKPWINYEICQWSDNALSCFYKNGGLIYQAEFTLECGCIISKGWGAIGEKKFSDEIYVYPVPVKDEFTIDNNTQYDVIINLIDINGKVLITMDLLTRNKKNINISLLPTGMYSLQFIADNIEIGYKKIIKK